MIYVDYYYEGARHFHKIEGSSFDIIELHIGKEERDFDGGCIKTNLPIAFTLKTDLNETYKFTINTGFYESSNSYKIDKRTYYMNWFFLVSDKEKAMFGSTIVDKENQIYKTNNNFHKEIREYFENKIKPDTDFLRRSFQECKKLKYIQDDFEV